MSVDRLTRVNELLRREIGEALYHVFKETELDFAAVTITEVSASRDLQAARVKVSIREHHADRDAILRHLTHHRGAIQALINRHMQLKYTPRLTFVLDRSVEKGDHVLDVLRQMDIEAQTQEGAAPEPDAGQPEEGSESPAT